MQLYASSDEYMYNLECLTSNEAKKKWKTSIKEAWNNSCAYCGNTHNLTLDHITSRAKGGTDRITNILCACTSCNRSKGHQYWVDWYRSQKFYTQDRLAKIIEWQKQIAENELMVYRPRKINIDF
jgi:hypothetical protein